MPQIQGTIDSVLGHPGANGRTRYAITISGQEYNTWKPDLGRQANERLGQAGSFNVTVKPSQDGQFMNYYFDGFADGAAGQVPGQIPMVAPGGVPMAGQPQMAAQVPVQPSAPAVAPVPMVQPIDQMERQVWIVKQSSIASAGNIISRLYHGAGPEAIEEVTEQTLALAKVFYVQVFGHNPQTLDDEIVEGLVSQAPEPSGPEIEQW